MDSLNVRGVGIATCCRIYFATSAREQAQGCVGDRLHIVRYRVWLDRRTQHPDWKLDARDLLVGNRSNSTP
jgi:hypothetical protein